MKNNFNSQNKEDIRNFERIRKRYKRISENHGAEIKKTYYITREEKDSNLYENAEFSVEVIKNSIKDVGLISSILSITTVTERISR